MFQRPGARRALRPRRSNAGAAREEQTINGPSTANNICAAPHSKLTPFVGQNGGKPAKPLPPIQNLRPAEPPANELKRAGFGASSPAHMGGERALVEGLLPERSAVEHARTAWRRVGVWRGGVRLSMSVSAPFVWRCLSGSAYIIRAEFVAVAHAVSTDIIPRPGKRDRHGVRPDLAASS